MSNKKEDILKNEIFKKVKQYYTLVHKPKKFIPGKSYIPYAGRVFDEKELINLVDSSLEFWLTTGRFANQFEKEFAKFLGVKHCILTNSGSSANLLAFMALTSPKLGDRRIKKGDEVIAVAAGFPTTVAPIIQYGAIPVFVDITLPTYNIDCNQLENALSDKTKAIMLAHTLGNPFDIKAVKKSCDKHNLWLIEDNCDALGSRYFYNGEWRYTGTFGNIGTSSFYPPHHISMGEGGAVYTNDHKLKKILLSMRDWGRDCWCEPGHDNTCGKRFDWQLGKLPFGYDHKYIYSHLGYNLKITDMQAAVGVAQLEKLPMFIEARKRNFHSLYEGLKDIEEFFILPVIPEKADPSPFGFVLTVRDGAPFAKAEIVAYLEEKGIQTRMVFAGNMVRQPAMEGVTYRQVGDLRNTDKVMNDTFWIGVYSGLTEEMISFIIEKIKGFVKGKK